MDKIALALLMLASAFFFAKPLWRRLHIVGLGGGSLGVDPLGPRIATFVTEVLFQSKVIRERPFAGLMHALVFWGFLGFALETIDHFAKGFGFSILGDGAFHAGFSWILTLVAFLVTVGIVALGIRRFVFRPTALGKLSMESLVVQIFIVALMVTYILPEIGVVDEETTAGRVNWWVHALVILVFAPLIVQSKHLHLVLAPFTIFLKDRELARIRPLDFEAEEFGAEKLTDLSKHSLLGAFTCVECGRCQDHCPAFNTGKALNPKALMLDLETGLLKDPATEVIAGGVISEDVIWQCTTCGACTDQCPVGIDQVVPILDLRRGLVANGSFPDTFTTFFKNLETSGNPWAYPAEHGRDFVTDQGFPIYEKGTHEVLYWMGCLGRNDDKYRKTAVAFRQVLDGAGVKWGVLADEKCTGDAARRAGNEFLFTMLCENNVEVLNDSAPKKIVATCPHCVRTIEEYRDFGLDPSIEITHHSAFIDELIRNGALKLKPEDESITYHDPCYVSRYQKPNGVDAPRRVLEAAGATISEPRRTGSRSFCCGAGGAMVFSEETEGTRINHERVDELLETKVNAVAVGCPFCRLMVSDGLADRGHEEISVKDIAQITADRLD